MQALPSHQTQGARPPRPRAYHSAIHTGPALSWPVHSPCRAARRRAAHRHAALASESSTVLTKDVITQLDTYLQQGSDAGEDSALKLVRELKEAGKVKGFDGGRQIPKRQYTIEELRLNNIDAAKLLSPEDKSLNSVRNAGQAAALAGLAAYAFSLGFDGAGQVLALVFAIIFALVSDQVANQGGGEALLVDSLGRVTVRTYARRVALHEAGHFLVAYLVGLLPRAYTLSAWDAFRKYRALNIQAGTQFCDSAFRREVASKRLSASSLEAYTCVALAGVITEALCYGQAEGGVGDVAQLDAMLRALNFTQMKADGEVRWAVLNTATLLRRHADIHAALADAMQRGESVGTCIGLIEDRLRPLPAEDI